VEKKIFEKLRRNSVSYSGSSADSEDWIESSV